MIALVYGLTNGTSALAAPPVGGAKPGDNPFEDHGGDSGDDGDEAAPADKPPATSSQSSAESDTDADSEAGEDEESAESALHGLACLEGDATGGRRKGVQRRDFLKKHRFELSGLGGFYASDALSSTYSYGGAVAFYPTPGPVTDMGWPIDPTGLHEMLVRVTRDYGPIPIYITENGAAFPDQVAEDGQDQKIAFFSKEMALPITLGLLLDTSGSEQFMLGAIQDAGGRFLRRVLRKGDEAMVISFDTDVDLLSDFTDDRGLLERAINKARINTPGGGYAGGNPGPIGNANTPGTTLYDAIYLACGDKLNGEAGRKAIVIVTDAQDDLEPADLRHVQVENRKVGLKREDQFHRLAAVTGGGDRNISKWTARV